MARIRRMTAGEPLTIRAADWNAMATLFEQLQPGVGMNPGGPVGERGTRQLWIKNESGATVPQYGILAMGDAVFDPAGHSGADELSFKQPSIYVRGDAPSIPGDEGKWCVLLSPASDQQIVRAVAGGVVQVKVFVNASTDEWAEAADADSGKLTTGPVGTARILYKETGTGEKWALISFPSMARIILGKSNAAITQGNSGTINLWAGTLGSESATGATVSAYARLGDIDSGKWVYVYGVASNLEVINAEC